MRKKNLLNNRTLDKFNDEMKAAHRLGGCIVMEEELDQVLTSLIDQAVLVHVLTGTLTQLFTRNLMSNMVLDSTLDASDMNESTIVLNKFSNLYNVIYGMCVILFKNFVILHLIFL